MKQPQRHHAGSHTEEMQQCIANCLECHRICMETLKHCLGRGGHHAEPGHITLLIDCAQICATSADFMLRGSNLHVETCAACAAVCEACADDCASMSHGDQQMDACVEACRRCAESCRQMAGVQAAA